MFLSVAISASDRQQKKAKSNAPNFNCRRCSTNFVNTANCRWPPRSTKTKLALVFARRRNWRNSRARRRRRRRRFRLAPTFSAATAAATAMAAAAAAGRQAAMRRKSGAPPLVCNETRAASERASKRASGRASHPAAAAVARSTRIHLARVAQNDNDDAAAIRLLSRAPLQQRSQQQRARERARALESAARRARRAMWTATRRCPLAVHIRALKGC